MHPLNYCQFAVSVSRSMINSLLLYSNFTEIGSACNFERQVHVPIAKAALFDCLHMHVDQLLDGDGNLHCSGTSLRVVTKQTSPSMSSLIKQVNIKIYS